MSKRKSTKLPVWRVYSGGKLIGRLKARTRSEAIRKAEQRVPARILGASIWAIRKSK